MVRMPHPDFLPGESSDWFVGNSLETGCDSGKDNKPALELRTRHWRFLPFSAKAVPPVRPLLTQQRICYADIFGLRSKVGLRGRDGPGLRRSFSDGSVDVGLDLAECDGAVCQIAVTVKDGVLGVLPSPPWSRPDSLFRAYSTKPSPSMSPKRSIQSRAASSEELRICRAPC